MLSLRSWFSSACEKSAEARNRSVMLHGTVRTLRLEKEKVHDMASVPRRAAQLTLTHSILQGTLFVSLHPGSM